MKPIFYFGTRPKVSLSRAFSDAGLNVNYLPYRQGLQALQQAPCCSGVLLEWRSKRDQRVIEEAKALGLPVLAVTSKLSAAILAAVPSADLYLEHPCPDQEVVSLMLDLVMARPIKSTATAGARMQQLLSAG